VIRSARETRARPSRPATPRHLRKACTDDQRLEGVPRGRNTEEELRHAATERDERAFTRRKVEQASSLRALVIQPQTRFAVLRVDMKLSLL
jgi:hypothetical protein